MNMIFSGMIHLSVYSEIVKAFFYFFLCFALMGVLRAKNGPKSLLLAYFCAKEGSFISRTGFSELIVIDQDIIYCELGKKHTCGYHAAAADVKMENFERKCKNEVISGHFEGQNGGKLGEIGKIRHNSTLKVFI